MESLIQTEKECYRCHRVPVQYHHVLTGALRSNAEKIGAYVWLCPRCHRWAHDTAKGVKYLRKLKKECQIAFEDTHTRDEWMYYAHRNYREDE